MEEFGSDKPDLRIDLRVKDVTDILQNCGFGPFENNTVKAVPVSNCKLARKAVDKLCADVEVQAGQKPYWFKMDESGAIAGGIFIGILENLSTLIIRRSIRTAWPSCC